MERRLTRSAQNRVLFGVAGGVARHFEVDPALVRVGFVILCFTPPAFGLLVYILLAIMMPADPGGAREPRDTDAEEASQSSGPAASAERASPPTGPARPSPGAERVSYRSGALVGGFLVVIGVAFLAKNLGWFGLDFWGTLWPVALIGLGVLFFLGRSASRRR